MSKCLALFFLCAVAACSPNPPDRPETVAVKYAEEKFGKRSFNPEGKGYNINVIDCGNNWCVMLSPALDPSDLSPRYAGGSAHLWLRKADLAVINTVQTQ